MQDWLALKVRPMIDPDRTLPLSEEILLRWRLLLEDGRKTGHTYSHPDLIIAATAAHYGLTVVTRDRSHFDKARVAVLNPWDFKQHPQSIPQPNTKTHNGAALVAGNESRHVRPAHRWDRRS